MSSKVKKRDGYTKKVLFLLGILTLILMCLFVIGGLQSDNINYYLPRRLIKMGTVIIVSYCVGYSSVSFQTITNNNILTPSVLGLDSIYLFIQTVIVFFFGSRQLSMMSGHTNFFISILAMIGVSWLLFLLLFKGSHKNIYFLVLVGMVIGQLFNGMATFMQVLLDPNEFLVLQGKMFASFNNINEELFGICVIIICVIIVIARFDFAHLDVLSLGPDHAINLGVPYHKLVRKTLMIVAVLVSVATVLVGPITFLGILVVSLSRQILRTFHHSYMTIGTTLLGCISLTLGLLFVERIFNHATTISVIINFVGGTYFIYLMIKESKR